ncbi:hypothetical protein [Streptomyces sp. NPDC001250]|uniref:hypothetical protein n=1 Tax=Streptomyces sp. NPDC001250 TaxID=3154382 RepID=UPI003324B973
MENSGTHATLHDLPSKQRGCIRFIAFRTGQYFEASVSRLTELPGGHRILYYGDLDADGMAIPARASLTALQRPAPDRTGNRPLLTPPSPHPHPLHPHRRRPRPGAPRLAAHAAVHAGPRPAHCRPAPRAASHQPQPALCHRPP